MTRASVVTLLSACFVFPASASLLGAEIARVDPSLVLAADAAGVGGTTVTVVGRDFGRTDVVRLGGRDLLDQTFVDALTIRGRVPNLAPGLHDAELLGARGVVLATLPRAVEVAPAVTLGSVTPNVLPREGGTQVTVAGSSFRAATTIRFGTHPLVSPAMNRAGTEITGVAPALDRAEPDGRYDVIAEDSRGRVLLQGGVTYQSQIALALSAVEPSLVSTAGGTLVTFIGEGFVAGAILRLGGRDLTDVQFVDSTRMSGRSPILPAGFHDAEIAIEIPGAPTVSRRLPRAVEAVGPCVVRAVEPADVSGDAATPVTVRGANFRPETLIRFGAHPILDPVWVDAATIRGRTPPLSPTEPLGPKDVTCEDAIGSFTLPGGVNYLPPAPAIELVSVTPQLISTGGGQLVTFEGNGFAAGDLLSLGGVALGGVAFIDASRMRGTTPALPAGFHDARVERRGATSAVLARAVEAAPPPVLSAVSPPVVSTEGDTPVTISGENFRDVTVFTLGSAQLVSPQVAADGLSVTGIAPAQSAGVKDVAAADSRGRSLLAGGVRYEMPAAPMVPAPRLTDAALAYGRARFEWENLVEYDEILVLDADDTIIARLPGSARTFEMDSGGATSVSRKFQGVKHDIGPSQAVPGLAKIFQCTIPPPLIGLREAGQLEFTLFGGHPSNAGVGCADGGGGGVLGLIDHPQNGLAHLQASAGTGYVIQDASTFDINPEIFKAIDLNKLTTGFTLETDADRLEIGVYLRKVGVAAGLELRGRLIHVFPDDGFQDELLFPEMLIKPEKEWVRAVYFRSYIDRGGVRQPCLDDDGKLRKVPAGEYLLDLYAVGGNPKLPYYQVADDPLDIELLIKGSPCPPYPMVQVTDLTGFRTVPQVECLGYDIIIGPGELFDVLTVNLHAQGTWFDFDGTQYRIHPNQNLCLPGKPPVTAPLSNSPDVEYIWQIYQDEEYPSCFSSGNSPTLAYHTLPDWGCYKIELTVRDKKCGLESRYSQELAFYPESITCDAQTLASSTCKSPPQPMKSTYLFPTPTLEKIFGVVGLDPPPGIGKFEGKRPVEFRVLVVPCHCGPGINDIKTCPSVTLNDPNDPNDDDVEFRLAVKSLFGSYTGLSGVPIKVKDLCDQVTEGPKYLLVTIDDLGQVPYQSVLGQKVFRPVYFQARNRSTGAQTGPGDPAGCWRNVGPPIRLANRPDSLPVSFWSGHFEPGDASYHFVTKSAQDTETEFDLGASAPIPIEVPDVDVEVPGHDSNSVSTGFTSRFMAMKGEWAEEDATGGMSGNTLGNDLKGEPVQVKGEEKFLSGAGAGGGAGGSALPYYEWCRKQTIFKNKFSTKLFESIIYTGTIGPIPVTVWGSIGLGLDFFIEAYARVEVSPFAFLQGGNYVEAYFDLLSKVQISIPCEVRADILAGIASIAMRLRPEATFVLIPYFDLKFPQNASPTIDYFLEALFSLYFEIEACVQTFVLGEQCFSPGEITLIDKKKLINGHGSKPSRPGSCATDGRGGEEPVLPEAGAGGGVIQQTSYQVAVAPVVIVSPDRKTVVDVWVEEVQQTLLQIKVNETQVKGATLPGTSYYLIDPAAAFVSNDAVIFAWTAPANQVGPDELPPASDPMYLPLLNLNAATAEVRIAPMIRIPDAPPGFDWALFDGFGTSINLLDAPGDEATWRADGRPSVAGDLSSGDALVAWVRYDTPDFMIEDGTTTTNLPCPDRQFCFCAGPGGLKPCALMKVTVPYFRPQLEKTAIFVRRVGFSTEPGPGGVPVATAEHRSVEMKISPPGINIQPWIATSPSGEISWCVWLNDSTPDHKNLIDSNRGRQILYSVYTKNEADLDDPAQWSAPGGALLVPDDYPALLEPKIYLKGNDTGLLVFTALDKTAPTRDTGLGVGRYLYGARLEGGVFGEPFRVHGKCRKRQYGYSQSISIDIPELIDPLDKIKWKNPEWVMTYLELGPFGSREGSGNVMVTALDFGSDVWSAPVNLTPDNNIHSNLAAAVGPNGLHTLHLDGGPAAFTPGQGRAGGIGANKTFVTMDTPLAPDPALAGCRLDFPFASPGSMVTATIEVENRGIVGTPVDEATGESTLMVQLILVEEGGLETVAVEAMVPEIAPGESTRIEVPVEMPLDPPRLRAQLVPGPRDLDPTNNQLECYFGAPTPTDFTCAVIPFTRIDGTGDEDLEVESQAAKLSWSSPIVYDEFLIYRDGLMVTALPGGCRMWIDDSVSSGEHTYEIRGRVLVSKSARASCVIDFETPPPGEVFRRGDVDSNQRLEITDPISLLNYLFGNGREPLCHDAADVDDSGVLQITDAVRLLNYLFGDGVEPSRPGPDSCGEDPTPDDLPPCRAECR